MRDWWEWHDPTGWTKEDLVDLAARGRVIWNEQIVRWHESKSFNERFSNLIDFSGVTFDHDFNDYRFPCCVDFSHAILEKPFFEGSVFAGSSRTNAPPSLEEMYSSREKRPNFVAAVFFKTEFKGYTRFNVRTSSIYSGLYFLEAIFSGEGLVISLGEEKTEIYECGDIAPAVYVLFEKVAQTESDMQICINRSGSEEVGDLINPYFTVQVGFKECDLTFFELTTSGRCRSLNFTLEDNHIRFSELLFKDLKVKSDSSKLFFKNNRFHDSWVAFRDVSLPGEVGFKNNQDAWLETLFYKCQVGTFSLEKCSFEFSFWQMIDCHIEKNLKFNKAMLNCNESREFPDKHLLEDDPDALLLPIRELIDHNYTVHGFAFRGTKVTGSISSVDNCDFIGPASFVGSVFDGPVSLQSTTFKGDVPDWRLTKFNAHFSIDGMEVDLSDKLDTAIDRKTYRDLSDRYRRLKELAITAKDHDRELDFFAEEMRTKRLGEEKWYLRLPNLLYGAVSAYGRSIARPIAALVAIWLTVGYIVMMKWRILKGQYVDWDVAWQSFKLSGSLLTPFLGLSRTVYNDMMESLFDKEPLGFFVDTVFLLEGALGVILIFLIGLALRNRFRL